MALTIVYVKVMYSLKVLKAFIDYNKDLISYQELSDIVMEKEDKRRKGKGYRTWQWKRPLWFWEDD